MKKNTSKRKVPKYEFGSYIENPYTDLYENQIAMAKADYAAKNNSLTKGMNIIGNLGMQVGSSMMSKGIAEGQGADGKGLAGFLAKNGNSIVPTLSFMNQLNTQFMAKGGFVDSTKINAEGGEVVETPDGSVRELEGPSHAEGGIDMLVPFDTAIYSKRLKGPDGKSMADRKIAREKELSKIQKLLEKNPGDKTLKTTLARIKSNHEKQEQDDMSKMQIAKMFDDMNNHFANGGTVDNYWYPNLFNNYKFPKPDIVDDFETPTVDSVGPQENTLKESGLEIDTTENNGYAYPEFAPTKETTKSNKKGLGDLFGTGLTFGDTIGLAGDLISTFGPENNTLKNRASDTPNVNAFKNYGKDALTAIENSKGNLEAQKNSALNEIELSKQSAIKRGRNSARGVNTMRALDTATELGSNTSKNQVFSKYAELMQNIFEKQATLENDQDLKVMSGEQTADLANRQDKDNYYTQMAQDIATKGAGLQHIGKSFNQIKSRNVTNNVLDSLFPDFDMSGMDGKMRRKLTKTASSNAEFLKGIPDTNVRQTVLTKVDSGEWYIKNNKVYDKSSNEEINLTKN